MAQKVQLVLVDDLDGGPADETVRFGLDGVAYEIDLTSENAARLREGLAEFVGHGRRVAATSPRRRASRAGHQRGGSPASSAIRQWAKEQGIEIGERGRIPLELRARYEAEHR